MKRTTFVLSGAAVIGALPAMSFADGAIGGGVPETQNTAAASVTLAGTVERARQKTPNGQILFGNACDLYDNGGPDGVNGYSNGTSIELGRALLDDFVVPNGQVWTIDGFGHQHVWNTEEPGTGDGMALNLWSDASGAPGELLQAIVVTDYTESGSGQTYFDRTGVQSWSTLEPVVLEPGAYWFEGAVISGSGDNNFWLTAAIEDTPSWLLWPERFEDPEDAVPEPGRLVFGVDGDLTWCLSGIAENTGPTFAFGLEHRPDGQAELTLDAENNTLTIANIGSSGDDGVNVNLGDSADGWLGNGSIPAAPGAGASVSLMSRGTANGTTDQPLGGLTLTADATRYTIRPNVTPVGSTQYSLTLLSNGEEVFSNNGIPQDIDFIFVGLGETLAATHSVILNGGTQVLWTLQTASPINVDLLAGSFVADQIVITPDSPSVNVSAVEKVDLLLQDTGDLTLDDEALRQFGLNHRAAGENTRVRTTGGGLTLTGLGASGDDGYAIDPPDLASLVTQTAPFGILVPNAKIVCEGTGVLGAASGSGSLGVGGVQNLGGLTGVFADLQAIGSDQVRIEVYDDGAFVGESVETGNTFRIALLVATGEGPALINGYGILPDIAYNYTFTFDRDTSVQPNSGGNFVGDEVRLIAENPDGDVNCIDGFDVKIALSPVIVINDESATLGDCGGGGECPCPGDANADCIVDFADILVILGNWGGSGLGDLDQSGVVDFADVLIVLGDWGCTR